ncbi:hypothetical protein OGCDGJMD_00814 [Cyanobium usitatum str. Tous]|nr:hypothetical protein OGCDGJMD_00814 [Cyanobium usitatum str. Tous]
MSIFDWKHKKQRIELTAKENKKKWRKLPGMLSIVKEP